MSSSNSANTSPTSLWASLFLVLATALIVSSAPAYQVRVNCGDSEPYDGETGHFFPDQPYDGNTWGYEGGGISGNWMPIGGTADQKLYWSIRRSEFGFQYLFDVPSDDYDVTLRGVEVESHWHGLSVSHIEAEGVPLISELDYFTEVERAYALNMRFRVTVADGQLTLDFIPLEGSAQIAAIEVVTAQMVPGVPSGVENLQVMPGYACTIVHWADNPTLDLKGYTVSRRILPNGLWTTIQDPDFLLSRFIDEDVIEGEEYEYRVSTEDLEGLASTPSAAVSGRTLIREDSGLRDYEIFMTDEDLRLLNEDIWTEEYFPADFRWGDQQWFDVGVRYRGHSNRRGPKKNWKIRFYETEIEDMDRLNLNSGYSDPALIREALGFRLADLAGSHSCRTERVNLYLNGQHRGIHTQIEQVDADWLDARDIDDSSPVFKCMDGLQIRPPDHYPLYYERKTGPEDDLQPIIDLIDTINLTSDTVFPDTISQILDVYEFMCWYSTMILTGNRDFASHNFYLFKDADTGKWSFVPWDLDVSLGSSSTYIFDFDAETHIDMGTELHPDVRGFSALIDRMLQFPKFRWMFAQRLLDLLESPFNSWTLLDELQSHASQIEEDVPADFRKWGWESTDLYVQHLSQIETYIRDRLTFLRAESEEYQPEVEFGVRLNEFLASNVDNIPDEQGEYEDWIEIVSVSDEPVFLGGMWLSDDLGESRKWAFPDTVIQPGEFLVVWTDDDEEQGPLHTNFKLDRDGETVALWDRGSEGNVLIDYCVFGYQETDVSMARIPDGYGPWAYRDPPTPGSSNVTTAVDDPSPGGGTAVSHPPWVSTIRVFPNPAVDRVTIALDAPPTAPGSGESSNQVVLGLFDLQGRRLARVPMAGLAAVSIRLGELLHDAHRGVFWVRPLGQTPWPYRPARVIWVDGR